MLKREQLSAAVDAVETSYLTDGSPPVKWVNEVVQALQPVLDMGHGVLGWCYDAGTLSAIKLDHIAHVGVDQRVLMALAEADRDPRNNTAIRRNHYRTPAGPFSASLGELYEDFVPVWDDHLGVLGVSDMLVLNAMNFGFRGCAFSAPTRVRLDRDPLRDALLERVTAHLVGAYRLRLSHGERAVASEAVLSPSGRVEHAEGEAKAAIARDELQRAVQAMELARGKLRKADPVESLTMWNALVAGRWTLVDQFESDGRRFLVAKANPPAEQAIVPLSKRESQVVALASMGRSNKAIAYELGVAQGTVAALLRRARKKLGATGYGDLMLKLASHWDAN